ncbi:AbrB/MazE/SpoVT family DNA-binding domain-containing protein [Leucobacter weissii]|uniref:AbrB/MazE/SpoVT family DNA-binding domain-containing protein n=1 Tax=Leucobacter weissii TaxID=1983706 RepID=A0A939MJP9_9MICO|nr:AbrB/MazE/SpoVT family DNA-binding domain-containing protein [Leucobacter weissii]MBO1902003.1 AbrB/MazE/SpoVT family DNA-binding domain-containing protein [Leucobacter weissii]
MSGTLTMRVGGKGRVVLPSELRARQGWIEGTTLTAVEQDDGSVLLLTREQLLARVRSSLVGKDAVSELMAERRAAAQREDEGRA